MLIAGMFFASTMVMVTVALVMAVIVTNIYAKKESPERCPQWCIRLAMRFYPSIHIPERPDPPRTPQQFMASCPTPPTMRNVDAEFYSTGSGGERTKRKRKYGGCSGMSVVSTVADVIVAADPYTMHCCPESMSAAGAAFPDGSSSSNMSSPSCGCFSPPPTATSSDLSKDVKGVHQSVPSVPAEATYQPSRRFHNQATIGAGGRGAGGGGGGGGRTTQRQTPPPPPATTSKEASDTAFDYATSEAEWRMVAKFTDRVFFWIFLALSTVTHCSLFMQMSPETRQLLS